MKDRVHIAGWLGLMAAISVASHSLWFLDTHTSEGSPTLSLGLVAAFLSYSAAAFGIETFEKVKQKLAKE